MTPEQALYLSVWHCVASWISGGARAPSFIGQTYPFPKLETAVGTTSPACFSRKRSAHTPSSCQRPTSEPAAPPAPATPTPRRPRQPQKPTRGATHPAKGEQIVARSGTGIPPRPPQTRLARRPLSRRPEKPSRPLPPAHRSIPTTTTANEPTRRRATARPAADPGGRGAPRGQAQPSTSCARREPRAGRATATVRRRRRPGEHPRTRRLRRPAARHPRYRGTAPVKRGCRACTRRTTPSSRCSTASDSRSPGCCGAR